jgi:hypothetical protein
MADKRANNGGARSGAGRPSKADEIKLIERLTPMADAAYDALKKGIDKGDYKFVQLFFAYYAGKPKESKDITSNGETLQTIINLGTGEE